MVDIEVGEFTGRRRFDRVTAASVVLTVDAAVFALLALIGVPFLLYIFADDDTGTWQHMTPLVIWWAVAALLGAACTTAVVRSFVRGGAGARRLGVVAAIATVVAVVALIVTTVGRTPLLAVFGALLAIANVGAARVLSGPGDADLAEEEPEADFPAAIDFPAEIDFLEEAEEVPADDEPAEPRVTVELARTGPGRTVPSAARRRLRGKAAMQTHAGVRLTRRPRR